MKTAFCSLTTHLQAWMSILRRDRFSFSGYTEPGQFPEELRPLPLTLEAYGDNRWIIARERPAANEIETSVERLLNAEGVRYIHIRNTEAGCFIARIERDFPR